MRHIDYFKLQAKNLFKDYKTKTPYREGGYTHYKYDPKYFDIDGIVCDFDIDEEDFSLMNAQHIIANMAGFRKWTDMLKASAAQLELSKLLFDNQHKVSLEDWHIYMDSTEELNNKTFDDEFWLELFKEVFVESEEHQNPFGDYRLSANLKDVVKSERPSQVSKPNPGPQITSLPLNNADRAEFIKAANGVFETVIWRMEPRNPELTRKLWDAEDYVDNMLTDDMLPISKDYALSLIDAFLVHHVLGLASEADKQAKT